MRGVLRFVLYGVVIAAAAGIFACSGVVSFLDEHLLLENTQPGYYEHFNTVTSRYLPVDIADNGMINQVVNNLTTREYDQGFTIRVHKDGSFTYSGTNNSENTVYAAVTVADWDLEDGVYIMTDSQAGIGGAPISEDGCWLYLQGRRYRAGGETVYTTLANMQDLSTIIFTTDHTQYSDYVVGLAIAPGYSTSGITFYPMVTSYEEMAEVYHPCLMANQRAYTARNDEDADSAETAHDIATTTYDYYEIDKDDYLALTDDELSTLDHRVQYQHQGRWTTIAFQDGTGIYYPDNDLEQVQYGELNGIGQMSLLYGGTSQIMTIDRPLDQTTVFADYLHLLNNPDYTILIAVRDEGVSALTDEMMAGLQELGVQTMLTETTVTDQGSTWPTYYRDSYYAVLNPGSAAVEAVSATDVLEYTGTTPDDRASYTIRSAGTNSGTGSYASIVVNDVEYAMNQRGMNLVVYDNRTGEIIDNVTFDTCSGLKVYREMP